jgi:hypothetical protein
MKYLTILFVVLLTGCSTTVPVVAKFPEVPQHLLVKCPQLNKLNDDAKLSDISKTIASNYTEYYTCAVKNDVWIEWYQVQKKIFEGLK